MGKVLKAIQKIRFIYVLLVVVVAFAISSIVLSSVFAEYASTYQTKDTIKVAQWGIDILLNDQPYEDIGFGYLKYADQDVPNEFISDYEIAPGSSGTVSIKVNAKRCQVAVRTTTTIVFNNYPKDLKIYDTYNNIVPINSDGSINFDYYISVEQIKRWLEADVGYIELGFRWEWPRESKERLDDDSQVRFDIVTVASQVETMSDVEGSKTINLVSDPEDFSVKKDAINILLNDISDSVKLATDYDFILDLNGYKLDDLFLRTNGPTKVNLGNIILQNPGEFGEKCQRYFYIGTEIQLAKGLIFGQ